MANHSIILLQRPVTPEEVEAAFKAINTRFFQGRLTITRTDEFSSICLAEKNWVIEVPGTRPKKLSKWDPDEDLGFCLWLHEGGRGLGVRHVLNPWLRWVQDRFKHELAKHFGVTSFVGGDGTVETDPDQYKTSFFDYATRNLKKPLSQKDAAFISWHFMSHVPEGWT